MDNRRFTPYNFFTVYVRRKKQIRKDVGNDVVLGSNVSTNLGILKTSSLKKFQHDCVLKFTFPRFFINKWPVDKSLWYQQKSKNNFFMPPVFFCWFNYFLTKHFRSKCICSAKLCWFRNNFRFPLSLLCPWWHPERGKLFLSASLLIILTWSRWGTVVNLYAIQ